MQQQHTNYDLLAVFTDETHASTAVDKLHKAGFSEEEVHQIEAGDTSRGQFREHGPNSARSEFFLQTQRQRPKPLLIIVFALIFGIVLGGLTLLASFALPALPEPTTLLAGIVIGLVLGAIFGLFRRGRVRGAIGQEAKLATPSPTRGERRAVALSFSDPNNVSRKSRARAILLNNQGKIDRSIGRRE